MERSPSSRKYTSTPCMEESERKEVTDRLQGELVLSSEWMDMAANPIQASANLLLLCLCVCVLVIYRDSVDRLQMTFEVCVCVSRLAKRSLAIYLMYSIILHICIGYIIIYVLPTRREREREFKKKQTE